MYALPIGVMVDCFRLSIRDGVRKAAEMGAQGLQVYAVSGEMAPENMTADKRREFLDLVRSSGLRISALCGDLGQGFADREKNPALIERSKRILDLARELDTAIVTTHIGQVPADKSRDQYKIMQEACFELSRYADSIDAHFAIETGPEPAQLLKEFLDELHSTGVAVNLDPANLAMCTRDDPVQAVYTLRRYIVHTHAKDGRRLHYVDPEILYGMVESDMLGDSSFIELPLGQGDVDFPNYLKALDDIGFQGFLTIEREVGDDPAADIALAVKFLQEHIR